MNNQEIFDVVANHLLKQQSKSLLSDGVGKCAYRGVNGLKCAVGILIPDHLYDETMEYKNIQSVIVDYPAFRGYLNAGEDEIDLLEQLQFIHDYAEVTAWNARLKEVAKDFALDVNF